MAAFHYTEVPVVDLNTLLILYEEMHSSRSWVVTKHRTTHVNDIYLSRGITIEVNSQLLYI